MTDPPQHAPRSSADLRGQLRASFTAPVSARQWATFAAGISLLALGVALSVIAGLGPGSWQVLETGLVEVTGARLGAVIVGESVVVLILAWALLAQPPARGTLVTTLAVGPLIGLAVERIPHPSALWLASVVLAVATLAIGVGLGLYVASEVGASPQDALFVGLYRTLPLRPGVARAVLDGSLVVGGWLLGGQIGVGTVVVLVGVPFLVEPALRVGRRLAGLDAPSSADAQAAAVSAGV